MKSHHHHQREGGGRGVAMNPFEEWKLDLVYPCKASQNTFLVGGRRGRLRCRCLTFCLWLICVIPFFIFRYIAQCRVIGEFVKITLWEFMKYLLVACQPTSPTTQGHRQSSSSAAALPIGGTFAILLILSASAGCMWCCCVNCCGLALLLVDCIMGTPTGWFNVQLDISQQYSFRSYWVAACPMKWKSCAQRVWLRNY